MPEGSREGVYTKWAQSENVADTIRSKAEAEARKNKKVYDPNKWEKAPNDVRAGLTQQWLEKVQLKHGIESKKVYGSLGLKGDESDTDKVARIREFQAGRGLQADGIIGPKTLEALDAASGNEGRFDKPVKVYISGEEMEETYSVAPEVVPAPTAAAPEVAPASGETPLTGLAAPGKATDKAPETAVDPKITEAENKLVEITGKKEEAYDTLNETTGLLADATKEAEKKTTEFTEADTKAKETEKKFNEKQAELAKNGDELLTQKQEVSKKSGEKQQAQAALDEAMKPEYAEEDIDEIRKTYEEAEKAEREAMRKELEIGDRRIILVNDVEKLKTENGTTQGELEKAKKAKESSDQNLEAADAENKLVSEDFNQLAREEMAAKNALEAAKNPTPAPAPTPEPTPAPTTDTPASSSPILDDFKASLKPKPLDYSVPPKE